MYLDTMMRITLSFLLHLKKIRDACDVHHTTVEKGYVMITHVMRIKQLWKEAL